MELKDIEKQVLNMVIAGNTNMSIGEEIGYSEKTVARIVKRLFNYYNVSNRLELVREVIKKQVA